MIGRCPKHGQQLCALTSPDAIAVAPPGGASNLLMVCLMHEGRVEYPVFVTKAFAQQHGIVGEQADFEEVYVRSEWFRELVSMCSACFTERWPELTERAWKLWGTNEPRPQGSG